MDVFDLYLFFFRDILLVLIQKRNIGSFGNQLWKFTSVLYAVYKATGLMFHGENEVDEVRSFSIKLLQKISTMKNIVDDNIVIFPNLSKVVSIVYLYPSLLFPSFYMSITLLAYAFKVSYIVD